MVPKIGIRCKNIPDLFVPIMEIPFIQNKKDSSPGKKTTQESVNKNGLSIFML